MTFLDTSLLVRWYAGRRGRGRRGIDGGVWVSEIARVEFSSAIRRRIREGSLERAAGHRILGDFAKDLEDWFRVPVDTAVLDRAAVLVERHPLRSLDAIHLASALLAAEGAPERLRFGSSDGDLAAAAEAEGLEVLRA